MPLKSLGPISPITTSPQVSPFGLPTKDTSDTQFCDASSVMSGPMSGAFSRGLSGLPLLAPQPTLAELQNSTSRLLLQSPPPGWDSQPAPQPEAKRGNLLQRGIRQAGKWGGSGLRVAGQGIGWTGSAVTKNNPVALVSRGLSAGSEALGAPKGVTKVLGSVDRGSQHLGNGVKSVVGGVGEFGAATVEGVTEIAADPVSAGKGIAIAASAGADAVPGLGRVTTGTEALITRRKFEEVRQDKSQTRGAIWDGMVQEHRQVESRVGTLGAWTKVGLDVVGIAKSSAVQGGRTGARFSRLVPETSTRPVGELAQRSTPRTAFDANAISQQITKKTDEMRPFDGVKPEFWGETRAIGAQARKMIDEAVKEGRLGPDAGKMSEVERMTSWLISRKLKKEGVELRPDTVDSFSPFQRPSPGQARAKTEPAKLSGLDQATVTTIKTKPSYGTETSASLMFARRVMEKPEEVATKNGPLKVYNASEVDVFVAKTAVDAMESTAPKLAPYLKEVHFENMLESQVTKIQGNLPKSGTPIAITDKGGTNGHMFTSDAGRGMTTGDTVRVVRRPPNTGTKGINRALEQHGKDIPDGTLRVGKVSGTIIHETAHLLDRAQGWISKKPDSPFGKGDKLTPGRSADYASDYAKTMPEEDFAETVRVVVELGSHKTLDPDLAGPISDILRQKYLRAAQEIGADPAVLQRLPGWVE